jgi:hypothetical protein
MSVLALWAVALSAATPSTAPIVVTRDSLALPSGCSPREAAQVVLRWGPIAEATHVVVRVTATNSRTRARVRFAASANMGYTASTTINCGRHSLIPPRRIVFTGPHCLSCILDAPPKLCPAEEAAAVVACSATGQTPNAQEVAANFIRAASPGRLPPRCSLGPVEARVLRLVRAFNVGDGGAFAAAFTRDGVFEPYTGTITTGIVGRRAIGKFAANRHMHGDGWTLTGLAGPTTAAAAGAIYGLGLQVWSRSNLAFDMNPDVKLVIDCRSGLISRWVGPALALPD